MGSGVLGMLTVTLAKLFLMQPAAPPSRAMARRVALDVGGSGPKRETYSRTHFMD